MEVERVVETIEPRSGPGLESKPAGKRYKGDDVFGPVDYDALSEEFDDEPTTSSKIDSFLIKILETKVASKGNTKSPKSSPNKPKSSATLNENAAQPSTGMLDMPKL